MIHLYQCHQDLRVGHFGNKSYNDNKMCMTSSIWVCSGCTYLSRLHVDGYIRTSLNFHQVCVHKAVPVPEVLNTFLSGFGLCWNEHVGGQSEQSDDQQCQLTDSSASACVGCQWQLSSWQRRTLSGNSWYMQFEIPTIIVVAYKSLVLESANALHTCANLCIPLLHVL